MTDIRWVANNKIEALAFADRGMCLREVRQVQREAGLLPNALGRRAIIRVYFVTLRDRYPFGRKTTQQRVIEGPCSECWVEKSDPLSAHGPFSCEKDFSR